ncbi:MAG: hypothetical protein FJ216_09485 [Ignavibacteria bacterium]|nr:hypothetical protein [Ignavibacteria bacterium]
MSLVLTGLTYLGFSIAKLFPLKLNPVENFTMSNKLKYPSAPNNHAGFAFVSIVPYPGFVVTL